MNLGIKGDFEMFMNTRVDRSWRLLTTLFCSETIPCRFYLFVHKLKCTYLFSFKIILMSK